MLRQALLGAGAATLGIAGIAYAAKGSYRGAGSPTLSAARRPKRHSAGTTHTQHHASHHASSPSNVPQGAVKLGPSNAVPRGKAALYRDPSDGQPDVIIRDTGGQLTAMSAVCTHAGCQVSYQSGQLFCPCHGSVFNARTGAVERGPASQPLAVKHVVESGGEIYAVPS